MDLVLRLEAGSSEAGPLFFAAVLDHFLSSREVVVHAAQ
jgi:hypothetical protein